LEVNYLYPNYRDLEVQMKILITIEKNEVAPRFDQASEILIIKVEGVTIKGEPRIMLLPGTSGEDICGLAIKEDISLVVCGGIEDAHFQYLKWKKIKVIDGVIGPYEQAVHFVIKNKLIPGLILPGASIFGDLS
jgi:predicted Fe-Mo cluster-binding NifX family protein